MRIIAGRHRGTQLSEVGQGDAQAHLRPTSDRVRENLFNILEGGRFGRVVQDAHVLDLFAGTGALGLEALSRGAAHVTFVDNGAVALRLLKSNIAKLRRAQDCDIVRSRADELPKASRGCSLVFLDPPYGSGLGQSALLAARRNGWIEPSALVVWEDATAQLPPEGFLACDQRRYGQTWITLLKVKP